MRDEAGKISRVLMKITPKECVFYDSSGRHSERFNQGADIRSPFLKR